MLVGPSKVLFMDEISTGLDSSTTFQIVNSIKQYSMELLSSPSSSQHQRLIIFSMTLFSSLMARLYTRVLVNKCLNFLNQWALNVLRGKGWPTSCKK